MFPLPDASKGIEGQMKIEVVEAIFMQVNSAPVNMEPLSDAIEWHEGEEPLVAEDELKIALEHLEVDIDDLYYDENAFAFLDRFVYFDGLVWVGISSFDMEYLEFSQRKKAIHAGKKMIAKYISEDNWSMAFVLMDKRISMANFILLNDQVPKDQLIDVFAEVWVRAESGFDMFDNDMIREIYAKGEPSERFLKAKTYLASIADEEGFLTVYRGVNDTTEDVLSWSLKKDVAEWFSNRFNKMGTLEKARVHVDNVIDYFDFRNEYEVLVFPEDIVKDN